MNQRSDIDRVLEVWMTDGPNVMPDRIVGAVAIRISRQRQRRSWPFLRRTTMTQLKLAAALAAAVVIAVVGYNLLPRQGSVGGPPTPLPSPTNSPGVVHATEFGVPLTLTLVDGWRKDGIARANLDLQRGTVDLGFHPLSVVTLPGPTDADPWIAVPTDFVAWIKGRPEYLVGDPRTVTVGGRAATQIDGEFVWKTGTPERDLVRYTGGAWRYDHLDAGAKIRFIIVAGPPGSGVMIVMNAKDADFDAAAAALDALLATVQFDVPTASPST